ncbi:DUF3920 family protein [Bacillus sp. UMB0728]|uniref:DUF3920 family protein n=1 Tax=Bacillus sp. UMB0728 TaxID=2066052 RepID=UPI000C7683EB|nr:hypothetical protein CYJ37_11800 [Bacillus sp. UMB0728]
MTSNFNKEIYECLDLLHEDYKGKCDIHIFYSKFDYIMWTAKNLFFDLRQIKKIFKDKILGCYFSGNKMIHIYAFNHKFEDRYLKQCVLHTLLHELRHYYQNENNTKYWNMKHTYKVTDEDYSTAPIEKDANKFANRMMIKHRDKFSDYLNVYPDWDVKG